MRGSLSVKRRRHQENDKNTMYNNRLFATGPLGRVALERQAPVYHHTPSIPLGAHSPWPYNRAVAAMDAARATPVRSPPIPHHVSRISYCPAWVMYRTHGRAWYPEFSTTLRNRTCRPDTVK